MEFKRLEVFEAIMRSGTVSAAARELGMTQSAVSRILARFEEDLGYQLFARTNGRLVATARADAVLVQVREVLVSVSGLREMQSDRIARRADKLSFVTVPSVAHDLIPAVLRRLRVLRPTLRLDFDVRTTEAAIDVMVRGGAEFGLVALPVSHPTLRATPLYRTTSCCVLPAAHPLARQEAVAAEDLRGEGLIFLLRRQPTRRLIEEAFLRAGVVPDIRLETANVATACRCTAEGLGIAVVNALMAGFSAPEGLAIRRFLPGIHHTLALIEPAGRPRGAEVVAFVACLCDAVEAVAAARGIAVERLAEGIPNRNGASPP